MASKRRTMAERKLKNRREAYDRLGANEKAERRRPGSLNPKKG